MRIIPSKLSWHGLTWRTPADGRLEGDWSPMEDRYVALIVIPGTAHPLERLGVHAVRVREDPFRPVEIVPAGPAEKIGYNETCRPSVLHDLTICWALGNMHARELSERFGAAPEPLRVRTIDRLPSGDFLVAARVPGFAASCRFDDAACEGALAHGDRVVRFQFPLERLNSWSDLRRELGELLDEATGQPLDERPGLVWLPSRAE